MYVGVGLEVEDFAVVDSFEDVSQRDADSLGSSKTYLRQYRAGQRKANV